MSLETSERTDHEGRVALITGSTRGIGRATAETLARGGCHLVINGRDQERLDEAGEALRHLGAEVVQVQGSVADPELPARMAAAAEPWGRIDYVVNNVAVSPLYQSLTEEADHAKVARTFMINSWAPVEMVRAALERGLGRGGAVVNVSTVGSHMVSPLNAHYCASKAAMEQLSKTLARELGSRGVRVNVVAPGMVRTDMSKFFWEEHGAAESAFHPLQRLGEAQDIADAIVYLLSDRAAWITGVVLDVDGGRSVVGGEQVHLIGSL
jgi:NAD(P)-dependent dehydrogenase (short-subunit alcohol dehydrogenase family)